MVDTTTLVGEGLVVGKGVIEGKYYAVKFKGNLVIQVRTLVGLWDFSISSQL